LNVVVTLPVSPLDTLIGQADVMVGDLFSVSPYIANRLKDLFVLNERVACE
jgi:phosphatidylserine decarboxylase